MDNFEKLLSRTYNFLSFRPRSEKEVRDYLVKKSSFAKASEGQEKQEIESLINSIIQKLKEQKFLDDKEFAKWWIEQRSKAKPKAIKLIILELKQKGIGKDLIDEVLSLEDFETVSDLEKALELAKKRIKRYEGEDPKKKWEKLARFLASKGFDYETIKVVIDRTFGK